MHLTYTKHETVSLKAHPDFDEAWLQDRIADDPTILGLGDLNLLDRERTHAKAGRLDLLLYSDAEDTRYEVELMLGATDESHVIRCIEYWDIERRRYPAYNHVAVLVAEDVTSRFLNVLALFSGTIPFIAIQLNALKVGDQIVLNFVKVLDQRILRRDDTTEVSSPVTDRATWEGKTKTTFLATVDALFDVAKTKAAELGDKKDWQPNYTKSYIGVAHGNRRSTFLEFRPMKTFMWLKAWVDDGEGLVEALKNKGFEAEDDENEVWVKLTAGDYKKHQAAIDAVVINATTTWLDE